ncbi:MAG TPA: polysaccharide deacetylase family protein [Myxococcaceae bacterium]|nr:polysaccharide deacetylase family protein [Myxococcaceae bacterium]
MNVRCTPNRKVQSILSSGILLALLLTGCGRQSTIPIFLWHSVGGGQPGDKYDLTPEEFEGQLKLLQELGVQAVTLEQYFDHLYGRASLPERAVVLSFDDGRQCQHSVVMPLLQKYGLVAETFLITSYLGESNETRVVKNEAERSQAYLIWPEVREMAASGAFVIEAHSWSHVAERNLSPGRQEHEIIDSRLELRRKTGLPINFFAYPFGSFGHHTLMTVDRAGFRGAMSVSKGDDSRFQMTRKSMQRGSKGKFQEELVQAFGGAPL